VCNNCSCEALTEFFQGFVKMASFHQTWGYVAVVISLLVWGQFCAIAAEELPSVERASFPKGFVFGTATAAYQVLIKS